MYIRQK